VDGPGVSGTRSATLKLTGVDAGDEGNYSVIVFNAAGAEFSNDATLTVSALPACKVTACDPVVGCVLSTAPNGTSCDDGDACSADDTCLDGACVSGPPVCNDDNACTTDACSLVDGCSFTPNDGAACNDGNACTTADACSGMSCVGAAIECVDGDACTVDSCDPIAGCVHAPRTPSETTDVRVDKSGTDALVAWVLATYADASEVLRGDIAALPVGPGGADEVCLGRTNSTSMIDPFVPTEGSGSWYLIRGVNACSQVEPYGFEGVHGALGAPRQSATCP